MRAEQPGCEGIVKFLLEREDLNLNIPGPSGETEFALAASRRHAGIV